jgi:hypothetical protein
MTNSLTVHGFGSGSGSGFAADLKLKAGFGFRAKCRLSRLETDSHAGFPGRSCHPLKSSAFHGALLRQLCGGQSVTSLVVEEILRDHCRRKSETARGNHEIGL